MIHRCRVHQLPGPAAAINHSRPGRAGHSPGPWGPAWSDTGKVFTREDGSWLHPETVSETFRRIHATTDLPPITFRDLRHVAATLTHAGGGGDIHTVKEVLRHSTIALTSDTYTSLLPELDREVAEKAEALVPRAHPASGKATVVPPVVARSQRR